MKKSVWIWISISIIILIILGAILFFVFHRSSVCKTSYNTIDESLKQANYCTIDSDCKIIPLGGKYVEFGCYHFVNKDVDINSFYQIMQDYTDRCSNVIDDCAGAPTAVCQDGKCVESKACTMEAKICPDGTAVGRNASNNCEFDPCPGSSNCTCPAGYRKDGDICNPECYYSTPKCLIASVPCE